jgi:hypothetical protein
MKELYGLAAPHVAHMAMLEGFTAVPAQLDVKFRRWDDILKWQSPDEKAMPVTTRSITTAARWPSPTGTISPRRASEREKMVAIASKLPPMR